VIGAVLLRALAAAGILITLAAIYGTSLVEALLPAYRTAFEWLAGDFRLLALAIDHEGADRVMRATVVWKHIVVLGGHVIYPDPRGTANASTLIAHTFQGPLVALIAAAAWPATDKREWLPRLALLLPMLCLLMLCDLPGVLAAELWQIATDALAPGSFSPLLIWKNFVHGGGRYALGLAAAAVAVQGGRRWIAGGRSGSPR
jgi:hypothetical protein